MFTIKTNMRPQKAENKGNFLYVKSTSGQLCLSLDGARALGVAHGSYVSIAEDEAGKPCILVGHGENAENKIPQVGSLLAGTKNGLNFSSENAYHFLGGDTEKVKTYTIKGLAEGEENLRNPQRDPKTGVEYVLFPLEYTAERAKLARGAKEAATV